MISHRVVGPLVALTLGTLLTLSPLRAQNATEERATGETLMQLDREFAQRVGADGVAAWVEYFAEDGVRFAPDGATIRGHEAIRRSDGPLFANPDLRLSWEPSEAVVYAGGDLGFTRGHYTLHQRSSTDAEWTVAATGNYLTLWRRSEDGTWKVLLDTELPGNDAG